MSHFSATVINPDFFLWVFRDMLFALDTRSLLCFLSLSWHNKWVTNMGHNHLWVSLNYNSGRGAWQSDIHKIVSLLSKPGLHPLSLTHDMLLPCTLFLFLIRPRRCFNRFPGFAPIMLLDFLPLFGVEIPFAICCCNILPLLFNVMRLLHLLLNYAPSRKLAVTNSEVQRVRRALQKHTETFPIGEIKFSL